MVDASARCLSAGGVAGAATTAVFGLSGCSGLPADAMATAVPESAWIIGASLLTFVLWFLIYHKADFLKLGRLTRQLLLLLMPLLLVFIAILTWPYEQEGTTRAEVLQFLGLLISVVIALSSTTFVSNFMAGIMLRMVRNFHHRDWLLVEEQFGQVTERGWFHVEIETEASDLITLPNLYLVSRPVKVIKMSREEKGGKPSRGGTIISATLSLGYDVPRSEVDRLLREAVTTLSAEKENVDLADPVVHILELGDFAVTYRVGAMLKNVEKLITARSQLHCYVLDTLHNAGIEIVSPSFMNQRRISEKTPVLPARTRRGKASAEEEKDIEDIALTKSKRLAKLDRLRAKKEALTESVADLKARRAEADETTAADMDREIAALERSIKRIDDTVKSAEAEGD